MTQSQPAEEFCDPALLFPEHLDARQLCFGLERPYLSRNNYTMTYAATWKIFLLTNLFDW